MKTVTSILSQVIFGVFTSGLLDHFIKDENLSNPKSTELLTAGQIIASVMIFETYRSLTKGNMYLNEYNLGFLAIVLYSVQNNLQTKLSVLGKKAAKAVLHPGNTVTVSSTT